MQLAHYDDKKEKLQSHEVSIKDDNFYNEDFQIFSYNITDIIGYGETKAEALIDFKNKFNYIMKEYKAFEKILFETSVLEDGIVEVDCFGNKK